MAAVSVSILLDMDGSPWLVSQTWEIVIFLNGCAPPGARTEKANQVRTYMIARLNEG